MSAEECIIHINFAESYLCKYSTEIQSVHFGERHRQVTLHTGVLYIGGKSDVKTFCTISDSTDHSRAGIWPYLQPVFADLKAEHPSVSPVHFFSDSPSTQYRQTKTFYLNIALSCIALGLWMQRGTSSSQAMEKVRQMALVVHWNELQTQLWPLGLIYQMQVAFTECLLTRRPSVCILNLKAQSANQFSVCHRTFCQLLEQWQFISWSQSGEVNLFTDVWVALAHHVTNAIVHVLIQSAMRTTVMLQSLRRSAPIAHLSVCISSSQACSICHSLTLTTCVLIS